MATYSDDPVYQQWLGTLGFLEEDATRRADNARTQVTNQADFAREGAEIDRGRMIENVGSAFENRGITRSGEHLRRRAQGLQDSSRQFGAIELDAAGRFAGIEDNLASQLADYQLRNSGQMFDAEGRRAAQAAGDYDWAQRKAFLEAG